jgi:NNP family nitrate/nitrite transporter-like MFS transporter
MISTIRQDLNLTQKAIGGANVAAITGTIFARLMMGPLTNKFGPRYAMGFLLLLSSSAIFGMPLVNSSAAFIVCRCIIGFSLSSFVACQYWTSVLFTASLVGSANALSGGWGNLGGGVTHVVMPRLLHAIAKHQPDFIAWRWAYFFPGALHVTFAVLCILFAQDLPDGNFRDVKREGKKKEGKADTLKAIWCAMRNYRTWILMSSYGFSFGIELTADNVLAAYFTDHFNLDYTKAGDIAGTFGLLNIISRPLGGILSDWLGRKVGMRGRLWWLFFVQMSGAVLCIILGIGPVERSLANSIGVMVVFSFFIEAACGAAYGVVPFISQRALGVVCGMVGAGGNAGSAIAQAIFFTPAVLSVQDAFKWMGVMAVGIACFQLLLWFPAWGGLFVPGRKGALEEDYYFAEYTEAERMQGLHLQVSNFCDNSRSNRGNKGLNEFKEASVHKPVAA